MRQRHAPRLGDRLFAPWHRHIAKMGRAGKADVVADEKFAAPEGTVGSVAGAVERDADDALVQSVLGHAACHVGVMVLHGNGLLRCRFRATKRITRRGIVGMKVMSDYGGPGREELLIELDIALEGAEI